MPMVMLSLPRIFDDAPVACLTPLSWCTAEGAVLVNPGGDRSGMAWLLVSDDSGQVLWICAGKNKTLPPSTSLPIMGQVAGVNTAPLGGVFIVRRLGPDGRKDSTTNSTATCSTWRGMGSVTLYFALEPP